MRSGPVAAGLRNLEQMLGVVRRPGPSVYYFLVAGALALEPQVPGPEPGQWIEPVHHTRHLGTSVV